MKDDLEENVNIRNIPYKTPHQLQFDVKIIFPETQWTDTGLLLSFSLTKHKPVIDLCHCETSFLMLRGQKQPVAQSPVSVQRLRLWDDFL